VERLGYGLDQRLAIKVAAHNIAGYGRSGGKPFTAADVKCTWDLLLGKSQNTLRLNPRKAWYRNLEEVIPEGDRAVTFVLKRSQPAFLILYPCHVSSRDMRTRPIGTGPFKFAEFKPNEYIRVVKNPDYWKPGRPYLDGGVEWTTIPNRSPCRG
jgi:peptide/nickel transport system substrate-binding protein